MSSERLQAESSPYNLSGDQQARMLRRLMLYWDGQWFLKAVEAFGLEEAIALNARVRASFGRIEMVRNARTNTTCAHSPTGAKSAPGSPN